MRTRLILLALLCCATACFGQRNAASPGPAPWLTTPADSLLAGRILGELKAHADEPVSALMVRAGEALDGQPYVAGTLEESPVERLAIYLTRTDCILYVETCLALARTARAGGGFRDLARELQQSRYRDGVVHAYTDRLHYTTEWSRQGVQRGTLQDLTMSLGGRPYDHPIDYMSTHPDAYPRLDDVETIRTVEERLNAEPIRYIPIEQIPSALSGIRSGDILCLVSAVKGLDILHVGMAVVQADGTVRLQHASSAAGKVLLDPKPLQRYLEGRPSIAGIQVYRPL